MNKNRASADRKLQILSAVSEDSQQLDLLSFVSDYALADFSPKEKIERTAIVKSNIAKARAFQFHGHIDINKTFSTFCSGHSNQLAVEAIKRFLITEKSDFGVIYLKATSGVGKTHILHAVANELFINKKSLYISSPLKMSALVDNFSKLQLYSYLLIDDLEEIEGNTELQKIICQLVDFAQTKKMKIIFTGSKLPKDLRECDDRFKGKLSAALIQEISRLDIELAYDIVHAKCKAFNLKLPRDVMELVSKHYDFNVYGLESILHKLKSKSEITNQDVSLDMALLEIKVKKETPSIETHQNILSKVASVFHISVEDLISPIRSKKIALARHVAMFIQKEKLGLSLMCVSKIFAKDHSSVIYAVSRIKRDIEIDMELRKLVHQLLDEI